MCRARTKSRLRPRCLPWPMRVSPVAEPEEEFRTERREPARVAEQVCDRQTDTPFGLFLAPKLVDGADVEIVIRPQHLRIEPDKTSRNETSDVIGDVKLPEPTVEHGMPASGSVARARFVGAASLIEVAMDHDGSILRVSVPYAWLPEPGARVWLSMRRDRCFVFPCIKQSRVASPHAAE